MWLAILLQRIFLVWTLLLQQLLAPFFIHSAYQMVYVFFYQAIASKLTSSFMMKLWINISLTFCFPFRTANDFIDVVLLELAYWMTGLYIVGIWWLILICECLFRLHFSSSGMGFLSNHTWCVYFVIPTQRQYAIVWASLYFCILDSYGNVRLFFNIWILIYQFAISFCIPHGVFTGLLVRYDLILAMKDLISERSCVWLPGRDLWLRCRVHLSGMRLPLKSYVTWWFYLFQIFGWLRHFD